MYEYIQRIRTRIAPFPAYHHPSLIMVRKSSKTAVAYVNLSADEARAAVMASTGLIKTKAVDPRKLVGTIHIKKYLADTKINGKVETWIAIIKKLSTTLEEGQTREELTSEEVEALELCKKETAAYLEDDASSALKAKVSESTDQLKSLKDVSSSMKFKFSKYAYEAVTHVINLMIRELLIFTCDSCASQKAKLTKVAHVPWNDLQFKLMAGLYMNTKATFNAIHPVVSDAEPVADDEPVVDEPVAEEEPAAEETVVEETKSTKPRLSQYISNTFKEIVSRDERFKGLLLGKEITALVNDIVFQVMDRYANVIKSLLQTANSKTVNERLAIIATKIILQDHMHADNDDVAVVLDVVQARLETLKDQPEDETVEEGKEE